MDTHKEKHVLLVDDDPFVLDLYKQKSKRYNVLVRTANTGVQALALLREGFCPAVILIDIDMPEMDGLELLRRIREEKLIPESFVIILTNKSEPHYLEEAHTLGINQYIIKATFLPSEVMQEVLNLLDTQETDTHAP